MLPRLASSRTYPETLLPRNETFSLWSVHRQPPQINMKDQTQLPEDAKLSTLLHESRPAPALPPRFQESVWRLIAVADTAATPSSVLLAWLERWVERLLTPRRALASLTLLLLVGGLTGVVTSAGTAKQEAQERYLAAVAPYTLH